MTTRALYTYANEDHRHLYAFVPDFKSEPATVVMPPDGDRPVTVATRPDVYGDAAARPVGEDLRMLPDPHAHLARHFSEFIDDMSERLRQTFGYRP